MTNEQYVRQLYQAVIGRVPDGEGLRYWINTLNTGIHTKQSLIANFTQAPEVQKAIRNTVTSAYRNVLGREPDAQGIAYWMEQMTNGSRLPTREAIESEFRASAEYSGTDAIQGDVRRGPRADGVGDAVGDIGTGTTNDPNATIETPGATAAETEAATYAKAKSRAAVETILNRYGLGDLMPWVDEVLDNNIPQAQVMIDLEDQQLFKDRFPAREIMRQNNMPVISAEAYLGYETEAREIMRASGMPVGFYDQPSDFTNLIANGVSPMELADRVNNVYLRAITAPNEVKARYAQMFGVAGEAALAAQILDPDKAMPALERQVATAEIAGFGDVFGVNIQQQRAARLAEIGYSGQTSINAFRQVQDQSALFNESITEGTDLTAEGEGVDAAFGLNQDSADTIERRRASRAGNLSGGGGLLIEQTGIAGRAQ